MTASKKRSLVCYIFNPGLGRRIKSSIVHKAFGKRKTVLIIGSNTSFGQDLSKLFEKEWNVYELDYPDTIVSLSAAKIPKLSDPIKKFSIDLNNLNIAETESQIEESMKDIGTKFEAIICITHEDVLCYPNSHIKDEYIFSDANKCLLENSYKQILGI